MSIPSFSVRPTTRAKPPLSSQKLNCRPTVSRRPTIFDSGPCNTAGDAFGVEGNLAIQKTKNKNGWYYTDGHPDPVPGRERQHGHEHERCCHQAGCRGHDGIAAAPHPEPLQAPYRRRP